MLQDHLVTWNFLKTFNIRDIAIAPSWESVNRMKANASKALAPTMERYAIAKRLWEQKLNFLIGGSSDVDFERFRPLRLSREEDWSDWLAWLLESSITGSLAEVLFGLRTNCNSEMLRSPIAIREVPTNDRLRRVDIVLKWEASCLAVDVEVKIEDRQLEKTAETAEKIREKYEGYTWHHFLLLSDDLADEWSAVKSNCPDTTAVHLILWKDVVRGLRKSVWQGAEPLLWRVWAWTFCRLIELRILRLGDPTQLQSDINKLQMALGWLETLSANGE